MKKMKVAILFGGKSGEHEVSIMSASNVVKAIDTNLFTVKLVYVDKKGVFWQVDGVAGLKNKRPLEQDFWKKVEVAFPVMHGPNCEDGSVQGFLRTVGVHCVGPGVLGSALGMDKDVQKQLLRFNGIKVTDWLLLHDYEFSEKKLKEIKNRIKKDFQYPVFVKPANMGSSVGISKVKNDKELKSKIEEAFKFDDKVIIEKTVIGREVECAVLGDLPEVVVSAVGEVVSQNGHEFYDYKAKYFDEKGARILVPAPNINFKKVAEIQALATKVFQILECRGLSRVDMFLQSDRQIVVNEINTLPGFTNASMYPKLMELSGISYKDLISKLIYLAK